MDLKLNVQKRGLSTTEAIINEEFTLHYGHIFKGEKGDKGDKGVDGKDGERGADGKSAYQQAVEVGYKGSEEDFKELLLSYPNKADKDGYYPAMSVGVADDVKNGNTKYLAATPSGDPMHYAYEAAGAVWNEVTGRWILNGGAFSTSDIQLAYWRGNQRIYPTAMLAQLLSSPLSVNFPAQNIALNTWDKRIDLGDVATNNHFLQRVRFTTNEYEIIISNLNYSFYGCFNLMSIDDILNIVNASNVNTFSFSFCAKLAKVYLKGLNTSISFADSPLLSKESLLYMIDNCASGVSFTISLHPEVYDNAKDSWGTEIEDAIEGASSNKGTTITLASA